MIGDNNLFSGTGNRVAVVGIDPAESVQILSDIEDPMDIETSPFENAALVVSGYGDALLALDYDSSASTPFTLRGEISYQGASPQLPGDAVQVTRGDLGGMVLVVENTGIRRVRFLTSGENQDLGKTSLGSGYEAIPGAIGITP